MSWNCACCARILPDRAIANVAVDEDGQEVDVGSDCIKKIKDAGADGYTHKDGPTLWSLTAFAEMED